jgi:hypothetical protein
MSQGYQETLIAMQGDGPALSASTTPTSLLLGAAKKVLDPGFFEFIGQKIELIAQGRISTVTTPGTLTLDFRLGAVIVANGGAMTLNATAKTNVAWWLHWILTCRAIGNSTIANLMHQAWFTSEAVVGSPVPSAGGSGTLLLPASAPAVGTGFDSSAAQTADLFGTWSINNANSIQVHQYDLRSLN